MGILGELFKGLNLGTGKPKISTREWLQQNYEPINLSDSDISAIVRYLKKLRPHYGMLVVAAVIFTGSVVLEAYGFEIPDSPDVTISLIGAISALPFIILFFWWLFRNDNKDIIAILQSKQYIAAYEILVTHKERLKEDAYTNGGETVRKYFYYIYTEGKDPTANGKSFKVSKLEYNTVRKGQPAVAITYLSRRASIFGLKNL